MIKAYVYIVASAGSDPDLIRCTVPWEVDSRHIFFGPCKKRIRDHLKEAYLKNNDCVTPQDTLYLIGLSPANKYKRRTVLWAGKVEKLMTFAYAFDTLRGPSFNKMRRHPSTPLHLKPITERGDLSGYEHVGREHSKNNEWISDVVKSRKASAFRHDGEKLLLAPEKRFTRDICILLTNLHFAKGPATPGLDLDDRCVKILSDAQRDRCNIDRYAVFGRHGDKARIDGRRGGYLPLKGNLARDLIGWVKRSTKSSRQQPAPGSSRSRFERRC